MVNLGRLHFLTKKEKAISQDVGCALNLIKRACYVERVHYGDIMNSI